MQKRNGPSYTKLKYSLMYSHKLTQVTFIFVLQWSRLVKNQNIYTTFGMGMDGIICLEKALAKKLLYSNSQLWIFMSLKEVSKIWFEKANITLMIDQNTFMQDYI